MHLPIHDSQMTVMRSLVISPAGWYAVIITLMMARRLYWICKAGGFKYHMDREAALLWNTWFIGLTVGTVFIYCADASLPRYMSGRGLVFPAIPIAVASICYRVYKAIRRAPEPSSAADLGT